MEHRYLGRTGLKVSVACMGTMTFAREIGEDASCDILNCYCEAGGTFIDTADNIYSDGVSEEIVGRWLKKQASGRDHWVVASKVYHPTGRAPNDSGLSRKHVLAAIDATLRRLQTDYVDLYQVHCWDSGTPIEETMLALDSLVQTGKVRYLGCSNFAAWQILKALSVSQTLGLARFDALQPMYSLLMRDPDQELLPACLQEGLGVLAYSPLSRGALTAKNIETAPELPSLAGGLSQLNTESWNALQGACDAERRRRVVAQVEQIARDTGKSPAQIALAWAAGQPSITSVILGARTREQLIDNLGFQSVKLNSEDREKLTGVSAPRTTYPMDYQAWANGTYGRNRSDN